MQTKNDEYFNNNKKWDGTWKYCNNTNSRKEITKDYRQIKKNASICDAWFHWYIINSIEFDAFAFLNEIQCEKCIRKNAHNSSSANKREKPYEFVTAIVGKKCIFSI